MTFKIGNNPETLNAFLAPTQQHARLNIGNGNESEFGRFRCTRCTADRLMDLLWDGGTETVEGPMVVRRSPGAARLRCRECAKSHVVLFSWTRDAVQVLTADVVAVRTPNTPKPVGYYLDEVARCRAIGARSAAAAMARSALEHLLHEQGFEGMLGVQIKTLLNQKEAGTAPAWARSMDLAYVEALKEIGNGSIHANGGNVDLQATIDDQTLNDIEAVVEFLLEEVYERAVRDRELKNRLTNSAKGFKDAK